MQTRQAYTIAGYVCAALALAFSAASVIPLVRAIVAARGAILATLGS